MLVTPGISDSDTAWQVDMLDHEKQLPEEDLQEARKAYHDHPDLDRMCNGGPECDHRVVYGGLPACYLHQSEVKKMIEWGNQQNRVAKKYKKDHT